MTISHDVRARPRRAAWPVLLALLVSAAAPAEPVSLPFEQTTLHGELVAAASSNPADGVVLIVHGTLASHRMELIETLQAALADRDISSLAVSLDLGEAGRTSMRDCALPHRHRHEDALAEISAWMGWLRERGMPTVTLLGHSRGGNQVAQYTAASDAPPHALVLVAPATYDAAKASDGFRAQHRQALEPLLERARALAPDAMLDGVPFIYCDSTQATAASFLSYHNDDPDRDTPSLLDDIGVPTLVIAGGVDTTVADVAERTTPHIDANTRLLVIDGADHFFRDFYAEDIADAVAALLVELRP